MSNETKTEIIEKAISIIDNQAEKIKGVHAQLIASHIIDNYLKNETNAQIIIDEKKTLSDCLSKIKSKAKSQAESGVAMISDDVVYEWVAEYYEFTEEASKNNKIIDIIDFI